MNEDNRQEYIEMYLLGMLEGQALRDFEQQLKTDKTLQADIALSKDVQEALDGVQVEQFFSNKLSSLGDKYVTESLLLEDENKPTQEEASTSNLRRNIFIIGLSILTALAVFWFWKQQNISEQIESTEPAQIFASYYEPYSSNMSTRNGNNVDEAYQNAIKAYDDEKYSEAIESLTQRIADQSDDIPTQLLLGNSYLNVSPPETQKAIELFQQIAEGDSDLYAMTAKWYLALAHLQVDQMEEAKVIFEDLSKNTTGRYANLAKEILERF